MSSTVDEYRLEVSRTGAAIVALIDELEAAGVTWARVEWHGSGDEGDVQDVSLMSSPYNDTHPVLVQHPELERKLYDAVNEHLETRYGSWYDGDGGGGSLEIGVPERDIRMEHGWYEETMTREFVSDPAALEPNDRDLARKLEEAGKEAREATARADQLEGALIGTQLLRMADEYGGAITGFSYETEWVYDDEGGYFPTASVRFQVDEDKLTEQAVELLGHPDDDTRAYEFSVEGLHALFDGQEETVLSVDDVLAAIEKKRRI